MRGATSTHCSLPCGSVIVVDNRQAYIRYEDVHAELGSSDSMGLFAEAVPSRLGGATPVGRVERTARLVDVPSSSATPDFPTHTHVRYAGCAAVGWWVDCGKHPE